MTPRLLAVAGVVGILLAQAGCGEGDDTPLPPSGERALTAPCNGLLASADPAATLPPELPGVPGQTLFRVARQGATTVWFAHVAGDDVVEVRDQARSLLQSRGGYTGLDGDNEGNAEADLLFDGRLEGSIQVTPLCRGHLQVRYRVTR